MSSMRSTGTHLKVTWFIGNWISTEGKYKSVVVDTKRRQSEPFFEKVGYCKY